VVVLFFMTQAHPEVTAIGWLKAYPVWQEVHGATAAVPVAVEALSVYPTAQ